MLAARVQWSMDGNRGVGERGQGVQDLGTAKSKSKSKSKFIFIVERRAGQPAMSTVGISNVAFDSSAGKHGILRQNR